MAWDKEHWSDVQEIWVWLEVLLLPVCTAVRMVSHLSSPVN